MTRAKFTNQINQQVEQAIAAGMSAVGTYEFLEESILTELENHGDQLPESTATALCGLLVVFGMRLRELLVANPAH